jgi:hypothetical protein
MLNSSFGNELTEQAFNVIGLDPNQLKSKHTKSSKTVNDSEVTVLSGQFVQHEGNGFGFIKASNGQSAFVSGDLIKKGFLMNGSEYSCKVVPSVDKQGRPSLKAVALMS